MSFKEVCEHFSMDRQILRYNFELDGLEVYNQNFDKERISNIFQIINTEEKAYWLGFLYADGYVNEKEHRIELTLKDKEHVEKFKKFVNAHNKIYIKTTMGHLYYRICLRDKIMTADLVKHGCFQNKSLLLTFPSLKHVPQHLQRHFIRGYFDGDGCISPLINNKIVIIILGTKSFLNKICKIINIKKNKYARSGKVYEWRCAAQVSVFKFLDYIYKDSKIHLDRKYDLYLKYAVLNRDI
jgi:intein-encoded DNA endonuclease-like protein